MCDTVFSGRNTSYNYISNGITASIAMHLEVEAVRFSEISINNLPS